MTTTIRNETPYYFSYCFSYQYALNSVKEHGVIGPWSSKVIKQQSLPSHIYLKYGHQSQEDTRHRSDLHRSYNGIYNHNFCVREYGADRSRLQLTTDKGASPTCPNYGKQEEDRREREKRRIQEEEKRRQQRIERERQIEEQIEKENKALEEQQSQFKKKLEMRRNKSIQRQKQSHILRNIVEDDALSIQITEIEDVKEKFSKLLIEHGILEDEIMQNKSLAERIIALQYKVTQAYALKNKLPLQAFQNLDNVFHYENLSLTENIRLLKALTEVTMTDATTEDTPFSPRDIQMEEKMLFLLSVMEKLYEDSKTTAGNIVLNMTQEFSDVCKEQLNLILFNGIGNPVQEDSPFSSIAIQVEEKMLFQVSVMEKLHEDSKTTAGNIVLNMAQEFLDVCKEQLTLILFNGIWNPVKEDSPFSSIAIKVEEKMLFLLSAMEKLYEDSKTTAGNIVLNMTQEFLDVCKEQLTLILLNRTWNPVQEEPPFSSIAIQVEEKMLFQLSVMEKLYEDSKTTAGNIVLNMTQEFSDVCKEQLTLILFNGIWNPVQEDSPFSSIAIQVEEKMLFLLSVMEKLYEDSKTTAGKIVLNMTQDYLDICKEQLNLIPFNGIWNPVQEDSPFSFIAIQVEEKMLFQVSVMEKLYEDSKTTAGKIVLNMTQDFLDVCKEQLTLILFNRIWNPVQEDSPFSSIAIQMEEKMLFLLSVMEKLYEDSKSTAGNIVLNMTQDFLDVCKEQLTLILFNGIGNPVQEDSPFSSIAIKLEEKMLFLLSVMEKLYEDSKTTAGNIILNMTQEFLDVCKEQLTLILFNRIWNPVQEDSPFSPRAIQMEEKMLFLLSVMEKLYEDSKTTAGNIVLNMTQEFSDVCKEQLTLILFNGIWNPVQALTFYLIACKAETSQENIETILLQVKTFQLGLDMTNHALQEKDPLQYLSKEIEKETDKDVKTIIQEMRHLSHPENVLSFIEEVLEKLMTDPPQYKKKDLNYELKAEGIQMIRDFDLKNPNVDVMVKILIVLSVAIKYTTSSISEDQTKGLKGYFPRATQFASLLSLLLSNSHDDKGCLLEIATGEGKSCIVALFALIQAIRGKTVDIITSSPVLARRDAEEWSKLYVKFDITCSVIPPAPLDVSTDSQNPNAAVTEAYKSHIVYGTVEDFAADILRQEFERQNTRNKRKFDIAIVDEVDYMTLDSGVQITFLSHDASGMRHLDQLLTAVWAKLHKCQRIMTESDEVYWTSGIQYFHKLATDTVFGEETTEHFSSIHILEFGVQHGLLSEEDLQEVMVQSSSEISGLQQTELEKLMTKFGPEQEKDLLKVFGKVLKDSVQFRFYELKDDKASFIEDSCDSGQPVSVLLLPHGQACLLMTVKELVNITVEELSLKLKYSDDCRPNDKENESVILLPKHLKEYTKNRLPVFVENALQAIMMEKGREYTIDSRDKSNSPEYHSIIPIDFKSTGVLEKNKRWGDGLQQFLELKHGLALSSVSCVTNFMSNFHFFQRYLDTGSGVYGVSGTLGDEVDFNFLKKHYKAYSYSVPTHRHTKRLELPVLQVVGGREAWMKEICTLVEKQTRPKCGTEGQCVLVVCEDVKTAEELQHQLINLGAISHPDQITMYTRSDKHNVEAKTFQSGEVILATNLGGRGTDFKVTKEVNKSGGLSVILTHFPGNRRVEKQIFGRTSRKGNPGMVQMVLNQNDLAASYQGQTVEEMRKLRENYEKERIVQMENDELMEVNMRHELFALFCEHLKKFDSHYSEEEKQEFNISHQGMKETSKMDYHPALNSLKETWALWLTTHEDDINDHKDSVPLRDNLNLILKAKSKDLLQGRCDNFYDYVKAAVDRTCLHINDKKKDYGALSCWQKMENTDNMYRAISLYNRAFIIINMAKKDYNQKAITLLREAETALDIYVSEISNIHVFGDITQCPRFEQHHHESNFALQKRAKMQLLNSWKNYIGNSVKKLEDLDSKKKDAETELTSVFSLSETMNNSKVEADEMYLLYDYGLSFVYEVKEKPKFCFNALICFFLGALQVLAGILICGLTCGAASQFGLGLISEGVSDIMSGIDGMIKGTFDWAQWAVSKAISIGLSLVTAGFNLLMKGTKAMFNITKDLLNGTRTFSSLASDAVKSGKTLLSSATSGLKSLTSSATRDAVTNSFKGLATSRAAKKAMVESVKFTGKELVKQGVSKAVDFAIDATVKAALQKFFKDSISEKIHNTVKNNKELEDCLINFIVTQAVPESAKEKSNDFVIPKRNKEFIQYSMIKMVQSALEDVFSHHETYNEVRSQLNTTSDFIIKILETQVSSPTLEKVKLSVCITNAGLEITALVKSVTIEPIINDKIIPHIVSDMSEDSSNVNDARSTFKEVLKLKEEMQDRISEDVSSTVIDLMAEQVSSLVKTMWEIPYVNKNVSKLKDKTVELLKKIPQKCFCIYQKMYVEQKHRNGEQGIQIKPQEAESHITKLLMDQSQSIDLELNVLTKSDLIEGRGVKMISVKEDGTKVSTEYYPGNNSSSETIVLQRKSSRSGKFKFRASSSEGDEVSSRWSGLYDAISEATGGKTEGHAIEASIHTKIRENPEQYLPQINREIQRQTWRDMADHYTIPGFQRNKRRLCKLM